MISVDTNILFYSLHDTCVEYLPAREFLESQQDNSDFVISELVLMELYGLLRNPVILKKPCSSIDAVDIIQEFRMHPTWRLVDHHPRAMNEVWQIASQKNFSKMRIYDARIAFSLLHHGVTMFATRNTKDFADFAFKKVWNPLSTTHKITSS